MDKIAILSDIHGNVPALEAVLSDIKDRGINRIICLGDIAGKGPDSAMAVDMIRDNCELVVKGNWDFYMTEYPNNEVIVWHRAKLGEERLNFLGGLPLYIEFYMSGRLIRLCHADPEDVEHRVQIIASREEKKTLFKAPNGKDKESDVLGYGDIHQAYVENFEGKTIFNVGSVGNPLEITQSSYAIVEGKYDGREVSPFSITLVRVPYDIEKEVQRAIQSEMPDIEPFVNELRTAKYRGKSAV